MMAESVTSYLILDGAAFDALKTVYTQDDSPWVDWLYRGTRHEPAVDASPLLVKPSADSRLWEAEDDWVDYAVGLESPAGPDLVAAHLRSLISVRLPSGQFSYCRFYSGGQLPVFLQAMDEGARQAFSGPIQTWYHPGSKPSWEAIQVSGSAQSRTADDEGWFQVTPEQLDRLNQSKANRFLSKLARHLEMDPGPATRERLRQTMQSARQHGFESEKDIARYAELILGREEQLAETACQDILADPTLTNVEKLGMLDHQLAYGGA
ncbi:uncharacterized protein DUF4123 [Tamilnaduibacter salinus]|uniref:Uncharacterized protein DUF4123 n=1 Tax=Tamilnaduibacter salinus TaxID=1484056 RepID=A0A2U1CWA7_9GAMM|nr:DUF4123 domain-containing protein [Tamilnaduibacter salinus]PVY76003.1 uncharacterized protein DUF4123 [Tamilnaduibacter salinus]